MLDWPFEVRWLLAFVFGAALGGLLNLAIYRLAWTPRLISPWSPAPAGLPARRWRERAPVVGWLMIPRDPASQGKWFWVRPLLLELGFGLLVALLYSWEVDSAGLVRDWPAAVRGLQRLASQQLHGQFFAHFVLLCLMLVASGIDIDEKIIPDTITVPGTLVGLILAVLLPTPLLPNGWTADRAGNVVIEPLLFGADEALIMFWGSPAALVLGVACLAGWCVGLLPRPWRTRHGFGRAWQILVARVTREPVSLLLLAVFLLGSAGISAVWWFWHERWDTLLSALVGMAASGGLVWAVRIIGAVVLKREAMGFGDVTLMAMLGAFLGWQACLIIFFLAPLAGLLIAVLNWVVHGEHEIPYGPFLCVAAVYVIFDWAAIWTRVEPVFELGWLVPITVAACLVLMAVLLGLLQLVKHAAGRSE